MNNNIWQKKSLGTWRCVILVLNYFVGFLGVYPLILSKVTLWMDPYARTIPLFLQIFVYVFMITVSLVVGWPLLKESYERFLVNKHCFLKNSFQLLGLFYICTFILNIAISFVTQSDTSANQTEIINSIDLNPIMMMFSTCIYAPIVEEMVFRGVFFRSVRRSKSFLIAALVSAASFGFLHVMDSLLSGNFIDLWYIFSYGLIGLFISYAYEKNESIFASIFLHLLNNGIAYLLILL